MITISDVKNRLYNLNKAPSIEADFNTKAVLEQFNKKYNINNFKIILNKWNHLNKNSNFAFVNVMEAFDKVCENASIGEIDTISKMISENIVPMVRNGIQTANYIKMRTRRFKTKLSTKINNKIDNVKDQLKDDTKKIQAKTNIKVITKDEKDKENREQAKQEAYNRILEAANKQAHCDRIINNQKTISKHFNPLKVLLDDVDLESGIVEYCKQIDRFINTIDAVKYNTILENIWYTLEISKIKYDEKIIPNTVTNYFLFKDNLDTETIDSFKMVLNNNQIFSEDCLYDAQEILLDGITTGDEEETDPDKIEFVFTGIEFEKEFEKIMKESSEDKDKEKVKKMMDDFRRKSNKTPFDLKNLISKFYTLKPDNIIDETPNILNMIRLFFVMSPLAINPILGCVSMIADYCVKMHFRRKETEKLLNKYNKEKEKAKKKLDKLDENSPSYKRMKIYVEELEKDIKKINAYYESLHTDEENLDREINNPKSSDSDSDDDFSFDINFDDLKIDEAMIDELTNVVLLSEQYDKLSKLDDNYHSYQISDILTYNLKEMLKGEIDYINTTTDYVLSGPLLSPVQFKKLVEEELFVARKCDNIDHKRIDTLNTSIYRLSTEQQKLPKTLNEWVIYLDIFNSLNEKKIYNESVLLELDFSNNIKLIVDKMKRTAVKLSDKEKQLSRTIDSSMNTLRDSMERSLKNENREAIIRGSILPSASKLIKGAILLGTASVLINPIIGVIGLIGAFACNKRLKAKERQLILDDLEIELKLCEKQIRIAEDNQDMKALKDLYKIQRTLQRQRQRIIYNMKIHFKQNVPKATSGGVSDD